LVSVIFARITEESFPTRVALTSKVHELRDGGHGWVPGRVGVAASLDSTHFPLVPVKSTTTVYRSSGAMSWALTLAARIRRSLTGTSAYLSAMSPARELLDKALTGGLCGLGRARFRRVTRDSLRRDDESVAG